MTTAMWFLQTFEGHAPTFELAAHRITIESTRNSMERVAGMRDLSVRPGRQAGGAALDYFVEVETSTGNLWLLLDSGNTQPLLLSPHANSRVVSNTDVLCRCT